MFFKNKKNFSLTVKEFIEFINTYPDSIVNFYICDSDTTEGVKINGASIAVICDDKECKIFIPYNFLEGRI